MPDLGDELSSRELDVLQCVTTGSSNREIAETLHISPHTVKVHLRNIYTKLGVSSRTEATTVALQQNLLTTDATDTADTASTTDKTDTITDTAPTEPLSPPPPTDSIPQQAKPPQLTAPAPQTTSPSIPPLSESTLAPTAPPIPTTAAYSHLQSLIAIVTIMFFILVTIILLSWRSAGTLPVTSITPTPTPYEITQIDDSRWFLSQPPPQTIQRMAVATIGVNVYQIGGQLEQAVTNNVFAFSSLTGEWRPAADKLTAVADTTAAVLSGEIYVPGGRQQNGNATSSVEVYSPVNDAWRPITNLPQPRAAGLAITDSSFLYYVGGQNQNEYHNSIYQFDPSQQQWRTLPPMPTSRAFATGGIVAGNLFIVGGQNESGPLTTCEKFDIATQEWSTCPQSPQPLPAGGTAILLNKLYFFSSNLTNNWGWLYTPNTMTWEPIPAPPLTDTDLSPYPVLTTIENRVHLFGGRNDTGQTNHFVYAPFVYQFFIPAAPNQ
ncbi:MAG TPA: kelch repeat-containing protein [Anaerolineae bacterium]|nr:kelch repeat-containing protein [Anaerolineae bacterium]